MKDLLHTQEGVRDIYSREYAEKREIERRMESAFTRFGYEGLQTPSFEFFDIFNQERGSVASRDMFKFFDREGNTLVLRPDMTPSIARSAAKYVREEDLPAKFCYIGNTFVNNSRYQGRLKEITQAGAELIGDGSCDADAEILAMVVEALVGCGLKEFQVDVGQVEFFNGLVEAAGLSPETEEELRKRVEAKNFFSVEDFLNEQNLSEELTNAFLALPHLFGNIDILSEAEALTDHPRCRAAIRRLRDLYELCRLYGVENYISFDLGMLGKYQYYTGIIFRVFTYGSGEALGGGGRYDKLMQQFGRKAPAVGFAISIDQLMLAQSRQHLFVYAPLCREFLYYNETGRKAALAFSREMRGQNLALRLFFEPGSEETLIERAKAKKRQNPEADVFYCSGEKPERMTL